jgi:hypothetical protein
MLLRRIRRGAGVALVGALSACSPVSAGDTQAQSPPDLSGLQITFAPNGVTFFDERTGDVWIHPHQITGAIGVAHFRVSERGAKLTVVPEKR